MKLLILGASGPTGRLLVEQALARAHEVTAFVRDAAKFPLIDRNLSVATGTLPGDAAALEAALRGKQAVLCALGRRASFKSESLMEGTMRLLVPAMEKAGVKRLLLMSSNGVGETYARSPLFSRILYRIMLKDIFADKEAGEAIVRASSLDWTIAYPTLLTDGPRSGAYRAAERLALKGMPKISRADVADFLLRQLTETAFVRKAAVLSD